VSLPALCEIEGCPMAHMSGRLDDYWAPPGVMVLVWGCPKPGDFYPDSDVRSQPGARDVGSGLVRRFPHPLPPPVGDVSGAAPSVLFPVLVPANLPDRKPFSGG
jgi:hypothetical protein